MIEPSTSNSSNFTITTRLPNQSWQNVAAKLNNLLAAGSTRFSRLHLKGRLCLRACIITTYKCDIVSLYMSHVAILWVMIRVASTQTTNVVFDLDSATRSSPFYKANEAFAFKPQQYNLDWATQGLIHLAYNLMALHEARVSKSIRSYLISESYQSYHITRCCESIGNKWSDTYKRWGWYETSGPTYMKLNGPERKGWENYVVCRFEDHIPRPCHLLQNPIYIISLLIYILSNISKLNA